MYLFLQTLDICSLFHQVIVIDTLYTRRAKRLRRKHERTWRHSKKESDRQLFKQQCAKVAQSIFTAKSTYYSSKVMDCKNNMKALTQITDKLLKSNHKTSLPTVADPCELPSKFQEFFETKIDKIRKNFDTVLLNNPHTNVASLKVFEKATASEVRKVIMNSPNKSCEIDSIPTWLLKECIDELLPLITTLINRSLSTGKFPEHFIFFYFIYTTFIKRSIHKQICSNALLN